MAMQAIASVKKGIWKVGDSYFYGKLFLLKPRSLFAFRHTDQRAVPDYHLPEIFSVFSVFWNVYCFVWYSCPVLRCYLHLRWHYFFTFLFEWKILLAEWPASKEEQRKGKIEASSAHHVQSRPLLQCALYTLYCICTCDVCVYLYLCNHIYTFVLTSPCSDMHLSSMLVLFSRALSLCIIL